MINIYHWNFSEDIKKIDKTFLSTKIMSQKKVKEKGLMFMVLW